MVLMYLCLVLLAVCLYPWWRYRRARNVLSQLPCLPALPIVGNLHQLMGDGVHILTRLTIVSKTMDYQRAPLVFWIGPIPILGMCDPLDITAVITAYAGHPAKTPELMWRRKSSLSGVTKNIKDYQDIFSAHARKLVAQLKTEIGKESFEVNHRYIAWMTLETLCQVIFGVPSTGFTKEDYQAISRASELYMGRNINVPFLLSCLYGLTPVSKDLAKDEDVLKKLIEKMINKSTNNKNNMDADKEDMLDQKKIESELITKIGAGHQILANAITMSLLIVGNQIDVQDKLYKEIQEIFEGSDRPITKEDIGRMQYCEAVIYETLRLYPFVPLYFLHADKDLKLSKCTIPKNTTCWINIWGAGRARNIWGTDTEVFRPERWLENQDQVFLTTFYFDYLTGLGKELSLAMLKTTLAQCVRELVIQSNTRNLRFKMSTALEPINGHLLRVQQRE